MGRITDIRRFVTLIGNGVDRDIHITHGFNSMDISITVMTLDYVDITPFVGHAHLSANEVVLFFKNPPEKDSLRLLIMGGYAL